MSGRGNAQCNSARTGAGIEVEIRYAERQFRLTVRTMKAFTRTADETIVPDTTACAAMRERGELFARAA